MNRLARVFNELSVALSREYLSLGKRVSVLTSYYLMCLRCRVSGKKGGAVRFLNFSLYSPSFTNLITIVREVFLFGDYYFASKTKSPVIVDCGGNIGIATLFFKWLYPDAHVLVLEPAPQNIDALKKNVALNKLTNVEVIEAAVGLKEGSAQFWQSVSRPGSSTLVSAVHETKAKSGKHEFDSYEVPVQRLSSLLPASVDLLKMDIEGGEGDVFKDLANAGALRTIKNAIIEYHDNEENRANRLIDLLELLEKDGLKTKIFNNEVTESSEELARQPSHHFLIRAYR